MSPHLIALAVPFGGPLEGKDLDGEYFSERTELGLTPQSELPVLWHHGRDDWLGHVRLGTARHWRLTKGGWVADLDLEPEGLPFLLVSELAQQADLFASVGAVARSVVRGRGGHIDRWLVDELSLSTSPQNLYAVVRERSAA